MLSASHHSEFYFKYIDYLLSKKTIEKPIFDTLHDLLPSTVLGKLLLIFNFYISIVFATYFYKLRNAFLLI